MSSFSIYVRTMGRTFRDCFYCSVIFQRFRGPRVWKSILPFRNALFFLWGDFGFQFLVRGPGNILGDFLETRSRMAKLKKDRGNRRLVFLNSVLKCSNRWTEHTDYMWGWDTEKSRHIYIYISGKSGKEENEGPNIYWAHEKLIIVSLCCLINLVFIVTLSATLSLRQ